MSKTTRRTPFRRMRERKERQLCLAQFTIRTPVKHEPRDAAGVLFADRSGVLWDMP